MLFAHLALRAETGQDLVLPAFDLLILDEAHEAAEIAREFFGFTVSEQTFARLATVAADMGNKALAGETVALDDQLIPLDRNGYLEECFFTLSYSAIRDETGIGGMLAVVAETTQRVQNERQLALLAELASRTADARTPEDACRLSAACLETDATDFPFAIIYRLEPQGARANLAATSRIARDHPAVRRASFRASRRWRSAWQPAQCLTWASTRAHSVRLVPPRDTDEIIGWISWQFMAEIPSAPRSSESSELGARRASRQGGLREDSWRSTRSRLRKRFLRTSSR